MRSAWTTLGALALVACGGTLKPSGTSDVDVTPQDAPLSMIETGSPSREGPEAQAAGGNGRAVCTNRPEPFGPVQLDAGALARRRGSGATGFASTPSTLEKPIEVCGITGEHVWLMSTACGDGSKAFASRDEVREARVGNAGAGGLCDSIVDHYEVACPEAVYDVYIDMYMCGATEAFM